MPNAHAPVLQRGESPLSRDEGATGTIVLIPAYRPSPDLRRLADELIARGCAHILVVDDGSGPEYRALFDSLAARPQTEVLWHAVNLGKGAALKTGINAILCRWPNIHAVITADADGQHAPADIVKVAQAAESNSGNLVLGVRTFGAGAPLRSRIGNRLTRVVVSALVGRAISDTQTGLRAIPAQLLPHLLRLNSRGYDFELDMLISCKHHEIPILEVPIETIYIDGNRSSHFNPLLDSMRIYFVLVRFASVSMLTALLDNVVFALAYWMGSELGMSQAIGRVASLAFNYAAVKKAVFSSDRKHRDAFVKYLALVVVSGLMSFGLIRFLVAHLPIGVIPAKVIAETLLFFVNFVVERDFVFRKAADEQS